MTALPGRPDEITPRWISALAKSLPGVEVARVDVIDRHSGTTGRAKLRLDYASGWVAATTTAAVGDRWQPFAVGMKAMRGATQTCAELETLEAFREAL